MKTLFLLLIMAFFLQACGGSEYSDSSSLASVDVFQMPKADCGGNPCM